MLANRYKKKLSNLECETRTLDNLTDLDQEIFSELIEPIAKFVEELNS